MKKCKKVLELFVSLVILLVSSTIIYCQNIDNTQNVDTNNENPSAIWGGEFIDISDAPWQVSIEKNGIKHSCGGSILNREWIVSAAHCYTNTSFNSADDFYIVHIGTTDQTDNSKGQRILVDEVIVHSDYVFGSNDIALLHLSQPLCFNENVQAIDYVDESFDIPLGVDVFVSGWGAAGIFGCCSAQLKGTTMNYISDEEAEEIFADNCGIVDIGSTAIALYRQGESMGKGDSGGPAVIGYNSEPILIGVASRLCGESPFESPSIYSDVSYFSGFIESNIDDFYIAETTITENKIIEGNLSYGNIVIDNGVTLTIKGKLSMYENTQITLKQNAKLIVDGGIITTSDCSNTWKGIRVTGGNTDFDVKFTNEAIIENTSNEVVSMFAPYPWPEIQNYGNGIIHADHTTFNNVVRIATLMAWTPTVNSSYFRHCTQNGGTWGINSWNTLKVEITDNVFNDLDYYCIVSESASYIIKGNEFHSSRNDILFLNPIMGSVSEIKNNSFQGTYTGFRGIGASFGQLEIDGNQFLNDQFDIFMDQDNNYLIKNNDFSADFAVVSVDNGSWSNEISNNNFEGNFVGILPTGNNSAYNFTYNCFTTSSHDAYVTGNIGDVISFGDLAAGNCFSHGSTYDFGGYFTETTYIEPLDEVDDCYDIHRIYNNLLINNLGKIEDQNCGTTGFPAIPTQYSPCHPFLESKLAIKQALFWLRNKINEIENDGSLSEATKSRLLYIYKRCYKRVNWWLIQKHIDDKEYEEARQDLDGDTSDDAQVAIFSIYITEGDLLSAHRFLSNISSTSEQMLDFITTQEINLERLENGPYHSIAQYKKDVLFNIAVKKHPYGAYAKSLYFVLTGELLSSDLPSIFRDRDRNSNLPKINTTTNEIVSIFPNPFNGLLNIKTNGYKDVSIDIFSIYGEKIWNAQKIEELQEIQTGHWHSGVYFVNIYSEGQLVQNKKLTLVQ